jgi:membrane fusion protein (multidrug efflux system)
MKKFLTLHKNSRQFKYLAACIIILLLYLSYQLYLWSKTQSTDNAYLEADISNISSEISGVVTKVLISDNSLVKQGDVIAEIQDDDYTADLTKIEATIKAAIKNMEIIDKKILIEQINSNKNKALLDFSKMNLDVISADYERTKELQKDNFASKKILDSAKNIFEKAKSDYVQAKLNLQINEQNLSLLEMQKSAEESNLESLKQTKIIAERKLYNTKIRSPIEGVLANSNLQKGNFVRPGVILCAVVPLNKMYIKANFKENQVANMRGNMKVLIKFDAFPQAKIYGTIRSLSPATGSKFALLPPDNATGNFTKIVQRVPIIIDFAPQKELNLVPGMSASVSIRIN